MPGLVIGSKVNYKNEDFDYKFYYEPFSPNTFFEKVKSVLRNRMLRKKEKPMVRDYDEYWNKILKNAKKKNDEKIIFGGIVDFDEEGKSVGYL